MMRRLTTLLLLALAPGVAVARGIYSEAGLGATMFLGPTADHAAPGPAMAARLGYAPTSWVSLGARVAASVHEATVPPPPQGELFQLYLLGTDVRFQTHFGWFGMFAEGSGGVAIVSTNVLDAVGVTSPAHHLSPYVSGGGGLEYRTDNPRFAIGIAGDWALYPEFDATQSITARIYLRYTR